MGVTIDVRGPIDTAGLRVPMYGTGLDGKTLSWGQLLRALL